MEDEDWGSIMIASKYSSKNYILSIYFTDSCNMNCPWCTAKINRIELGREPVQFWSQEINIKFLQHIQTTEYAGFHILGGEPLLFPNELLDLIKFIRNEISETKAIKVFTNGSQFTSEIVSQFNRYNVNCIISVGLSGPKSFSNLIAHANSPIDLVDNIRALKQKSIRIIFERKDNFSVEAIAIYSIFKCVVNLFPEFTSLVNWDNSDIDHISTQLSIMKKAVPDCCKYILIFGQLYSRCDCSDTIKPLFPDGKQHTPYFYSENCIYGCAALKDKLGDDLFNRYVVTVRNHSHPVLERSKTCQL